jgi:hypothetical protein
MTGIYRSRRGWNKRGETKIDKKRRGGKRDRKRDGKRRGESSGE